MRRRSLVPTRGARVLVGCLIPQVMLVGNNGMRRFAELLRSNPMLSLVSAAWRLFWLFMLVIHVGAVRSAVSSFVQPGVEYDRAIGLGRLLILSASAAFFVLKVVDVSWLRLKPGWRSWLASGLVVALLHVQVMKRASDGVLDIAPTGTVAFLVFGTIFESQILFRGWRRLLKAWVRWKALSSGAIVQAWAFARFLFYDDYLPPRLHIVANLVCPRPPPAR